MVYTPYYKGSRGEKTGGLMRNKIMDAILKVIQQHGTQPYSVLTGLVYLSDFDLIALAIDLGIDTDAVLSVTL